MANLIASEKAIYSKAGSSSTSLYCPSKGNIPSTIGSYKITISGSYTDKQLVALTNITTSVNTVSVTFNPNNGSSSYTKTFTSGTTFGTAVNSVSKTGSTSNIYTVTFDYGTGASSGESASSSYSYLYTTKTTSYSFLGWYYGSTKITSTTTVDNYADKTITASFSTSTTTQDSITLPTPNCYTGATFVGWYYSQDTTGERAGVGGASFTPSSSMTLYARYMWKTTVDNTKWVSYTGSEVNGSSGKFCINDEGSSDIENSYSTYTTITVPAGYSVLFYLKAYTEANYDGVFVTDSYNSSTSFYNISSDYKTSGNGVSKEVFFISTSSDRTFYIVYKNDGSGQYYGNKCYCGYTLSKATVDTPTLSDVLKLYWVNNTTYKIYLVSGYSFSGTLRIRNVAGTDFWSSSSVSLSGGNYLTVTTATLAMSKARLYCENGVLVQSSPSFSFQYTGVTISATIEAAGEL